MDNSPNELYSLWTKNKREFMSASKTSTDAVVKALRAICLFLGDGCQQDANQALELASSVSSEIHQMAQNEEDPVYVTLGLMYYYGLGVEQDYCQAHPLFRKAAEQGDARAQRYLGMMYDDGQGVAKDETMAAEWYRKAAEQGDVLAQCELGKKYAGGRGVGKDVIEAAQWYGKAALQGDALSQSIMGAMYATGQGVAKDEDKAVEWYGKSAQQGNSCAKYWLANYAKNQLDLGEKYAVGQEMPKDLGAAIQCYRRAAKLGQAQAQFNLGVMYDNGNDVVEKDERLAVEWYRNAAEQGHVEAQYNLAVMYDNGQGVVKDRDMAAKWYRKAAEQGDAKAQYNLGVMYERGEGLEQSFSLAKAWFRKAVEQGGVDAITHEQLDARGQNGVIDEAEVAERYRRAAEKLFLATQCEVVALGEAPGHVLECIKCRSGLYGTDLRSLHYYKVYTCPKCSFKHIFTAGKHPKLGALPWFTFSREAMAIRGFMTERGVTRIVHFTSFPGLVGILSLGKVLSRKAMELYRSQNPNSNLCYFFGCNDSGRWDMKLDYINMSIEHINAKLLWKFQMDDSGTERNPWCILEFAPLCLEMEGVLFSISNAASNFVRKYGVCGGVFGLQRMFYQSLCQSFALSESDLAPLTDKYPSLALKRSTTIPMHYPTDEQAEVLIPNELPLEFLRGIVFQTETEKQYVMDRLPQWGIRIGSNVQIKVSIQDFCKRKQEVALPPLFKQYF